MRPQTSSDGRPDVVDCRMQAAPRANDAATSGTSTQNTARQLRTLTRKPPSDGPMAGAVEVMKLAIPIISPMFLRGTCSKMMLNMRGSATPVPTPCTKRPASSTGKTGASAAVSVPARKQEAPATNSARMVKRRRRYEDMGMMTDSTSR